MTSVYVVVFAKFLSLEAAALLAKEKITFLLAGLLSVRYAPVSEGTKACKEAKA